MIFFYTSILLKKRNTINVNCVCYWRRISVPVCLLIFWLDRQLRRMKKTKQNKGKTCLNYLENKIKFPARKKKGVQQGFPWWWEISHRCRPSSSSIDLSKIDSTQIWLLMKGIGDGHEFHTQVFVPCLHFPFQGAVIDLVSFQIVWLLKEKKVRFKFQKKMKKKKHTPKELLTRINMRTALK